MKAKIGARNMSSTKLKEATKNYLAAILGIVVALLIGEGLVRIVSPSQFVSDERIGIIGSGEEHDARGFRNAAALDRADIVVLGDSQTYGNNAEREEAWPQQLGKIASATVYQMAFGGYAELQYKALVDDALALHPRIFIVAFYSGNDLLENYTEVYDSGNERWMSFRDPNFVIPATTSNPVEYRRELQTGLSRDTLEFKIWKIRYWMRLHSRLYAFIGDATREFRERIGVAKTMEEKFQQIEDFAREHPDVAYIFSADERLKTVLSPSYRLEAVNLDEPRTKEGWRIAKEALRYIYDSARVKNTPVVLLYIPTKEFVYLEFMRLNGIKIPEVFSKYLSAEERLQNEYLMFCREIGAYCHSVVFDLASALAKGNGIYGQTMDGHPLAGGYRVIAESVWEYLRRQPYHTPALQVVDD